MAQQIGERLLENIGFGWVAGFGFIDPDGIHYTWKHFCDVDEFTISHWTQKWIPETDVNMLEKRISISTVWRKLVNGIVHSDPSTVHAIYVNVLLELFFRFDSPISSHFCD